MGVASEKEKPPGHTPVWGPLLADRWCPSRAIITSLQMVSGDLQVKKARTLLFGGMPMAGGGRHQ
jgi:hypothetical protein